MSLFYVSFGIAVLASVLYHIFQKATSPLVNPAVGLMVTYATAFALSLLLLFFFPLQTSVADSLRRVNWASFALGLAILGLEVGFLLVYRAGWNLSVAAIAANAAAALLLLPTGIMLFSEKPSLVNLAGVFVCVVGLVMINLRS